MTAACAICGHRYDDHAGADACTAPDCPCEGWTGGELVLGPIDHIAAGMRHEYERGRAEGAGAERALVIAWLKQQGRMAFAAAAFAIEHGGHEHGGGK